MIRLAKYLKPYTNLILLAIALLFIQANCDLALPDYLSKIINIGIQQGGVESAMPDALRKSQMDKLGLFMNADDKLAILAAYELVDQDSPDFENALEVYPALANEAVYVRKDIDQAEIDRLTPVIGKALLAVDGIEQLLADPAKAAAIGPQMGFDLSKLPTGMDVYAALRMLPSDRLAEITAKIEEQFASFDARMITQAAARLVKAEYAALGMDVDGLQTGYIIRTGALMLLVTLISAVATIIVGFLSARVAAGLGRDLRRNVFSKVEGFSSAEFDRFSTASLITRSTNDITQIQMVVVMMVRMVFYAPIIGFGGIIRAMGKDVSMWWIIALAVGILITLILIVYQIAVPKFKLIQKLIDKLNMVSRENLAGMMVIRAFNKQEVEEKRFDQTNTDLTSVSLFINRIMVIMMPLMMFIMNGVSLLIIWVGAHQVAESAMQVGDMMAFLQYTMQIVFAFLMLSMMFIILPRAEVSADRIADVLEVEPSIRDTQTPRHFPDPFRGRIEFKNVSFRYPGAEENVLCDINFTAEPGQTTAFIGTTGSGKTTIISLIPRFYDVTEGQILVDGVDIRNVTQHELREKIGYVPQKGTLFSGTVESNLRYADQDASSKTLMQAAEIAQLSDFLCDSPEGMSTAIAQGGANVSGGQKQRLSIARALVKKPPIYILDDSFSAIDFKTDAALRKALKMNTNASTLLIVTQRVSTIKNAEQIIVLDEGMIVGKGTHYQLMEECEIYNEIASSQLTQEELA